jgi:sulfur transfer complex TusBCD TusB component (DsrH family)
LKEFWKNKTLITFASGLILLVLFGAYAVHVLSSERKELKSLREQRKEMLILKQDFTALKQKIDALEMKKGLSHVQGIMEAIDEVFSSLGLKDKLKTVKSTATKEVKEGFEEEADIYIEKVTMNEMVNIFYAIEHTPMVLTMKKATIKKSFENPELLNISLTLSFLRAQ